jgi:hypothetical protein
MPQRFNGGAVVAAAGGALLLVSLFLDWYEPDLSAWDTFELSDLVLAAVAVAALAGILRPLLGKRAPDPARERIVLFLGLAALVIVIASLIQPPPGALERSPEVGAWLGLVGAILIALGGFLAGSSVSLVITTRPNESVTPAGGVEPVPPPSPASEPVPPPPGTSPAPPESETSSIPTERG